MKNKALQELKRLYKLYLQSVSEEQKDIRIRIYNQVRAFTLDIDLITFKEVEAMEYKLKNDE